MSPPRSSVATFQGTSTASLPADRQDTLSSVQHLLEPSTEASTQSTSNAPPDPSPEQTLPDPPADASTQPTSNVPLDPSPEQTLRAPPAEASTQSTLNVAGGPEPEHTLPARNRRLPARYRDLLPEPPLPAVDPQPGPSSISILPRVFLHIFDSFRTQFNKFGLARAYRHRPSHDPDSFVTVEQLTQTPNPIVPNSAETKRGDYSPPWPWRNMSIWRLMRWKATGSNLKSDAEITRLVHEVIEAPDFDIQDLSNFNASREASRFDAVEKEIPPEDVFAVDRWKRTSIDISVPTRENKKEGNGRTFSVDGLLYRPILDVIRAVFAEASSKTFHLTPFKWVWKSPVTGREQRVYDELYASDAWNEAQDEIMKQRRDDGCQLERVVAGLMFWSDSTHLAQFGHVSAWPVYLFFGNLSKYARADPQSGCCHPIAFIPSVKSN